MCDPKLKIFRIFFSALCTPKASIQARCKLPACRETPKRLLRIKNVLKGWEKCAAFKH